MITLHSCLLNCDNCLRFTPEKCAKIVIACCILHNLAMELNNPLPLDDLEDFNDDHDEHDEPERQNANRVHNDNAREIRQQLIETRFAQFCLFN